MPLPRRNDPSSTFRHLDWPTVIIYLIMVFAGMVSIYAACYNFDNASMFADTEFSGKQLRWIGLSVGLGLVILLIDARMYETYAYPIYLAILILLIVTIFIAPDSLNASPRNYLKAFLIIFTPIVLILAQKETGSALIYMSLFFVLYREGMSGMVLFAALIAVVIFVVAIKFAETVVLGIPAGEFAVMCLVMVLVVGMLAVNVRRLEIVRNVLLWYVGASLVEFGLSLGGIALSGYISR